MEFLQFDKEESKVTRRAKKIMDRTLDKLKATYSELVYAVNLFTLQAIQNDVLVATDFKHLFYNPDRVVKSYDKYGFLELKKELLHIILHGFCFDFERLGAKEDKALMDYLVDVRVAKLLKALSLPIFSAKDEMELKQLDRIFELEPDLSPEQYYQVKKMERDPEKKESWDCMRRQMKSGVFVRDDHRYWRIQKLSGQEMKEISECWTKAKGYLCEDSQEETLAGCIRKMKEQAELSDGQKNRGNGSGSCQRDVTKAFGQAQDYRDYLQEYMTKHYSEKENLDSIDTMLYQYGLSMYEDSPLIEPAEDEVKSKKGRICIAIDTSGSCEGEVIKKLLREVQGLLCQWRDELTETTIHVITCDAEMKSEDVFLMSEMPEDYFNRMKLTGWGGTDFCPVYDRLQQLKEKDITTDLLLYFTDGQGVFPAQNPGIKSLFIMSKNDYEFSKMGFMKIPSYIEIVTYDS